MPGRTHNCPQHERTYDLAHDRLDDEQRLAAQHHLEHCESCRTLFRRETEAWLPRFRNYTIVERLGRGGFGEVFRAIHHTKKRTEALKVLSMETTLREAYFQSEVHLIARLQHPNIATLYEAHLSASPMYYTMELVEGERLDRWLTLNQTPIEERLRITRKIADAIGYAHERGVVHRDLKPQNVIMDADGEPRIVDFGIAKWFGLQDTWVDDEPDRPEPGLIGTRGYISPEQVRGEDVDGRADIYSLGAMLFTIVTGESPTEVKHRVHVTRLLAELRLPRAEDLAAIILRCTDPVAEQRYQHCSEMAADLERYLSGQAPRSAEGATLLRRVRRVSALAIRNAPGSMRLAAALVAIACVALPLSHVGSRWFSPGSGTYGTAIIAFRPSTQHALLSGEIGADLPGLDPVDPKSRRVLFGHLMERLAAARPLVVAWDYYFPDCRPEYDEALLNGFAALDAPAVVACHELDVNAEPQMCPAIRSAVHDFGFIASPDVMGDLGEFNMSLALRRGFNRWTPSLAIAAYAAARFPDAAVHLEPTEKGLELRYVTRAANPGTSRWRQEVDVVPVYNRFVSPADVSLATLGGAKTLLQAGDVLLVGRSPGEALRAPQDRVHNFEDVLTATPEQLKAWFDGRPIVVGAMTPPADLHVAADGGTIFGCEMIAAHLDALLSDAHYIRFSRSWLLARVALWSILAALIAGRIGGGARLAPRWTAFVGVGALALGAGLAVYAARNVTNLWLAEVFVAVSAITAAGGAAWALRALRDRQLRLTPFPIYEGDASTMTLELHSSQLASNPFAE